MYLAVSVLQIISTWLRHGIELLKCDHILKLGFNDRKRASGSFTSSSSEFYFYMFSIQLWWCSLACLPINPKLGTNKMSWERKVAGVILTSSLIKCQKCQLVYKNMDAGSKYAQCLKVWKLSCACTPIQLSLLEWEAVVG